MAVLRDTLARMTAEDAAERLQNIYGYYVDQKMWTDVTDLFEKDGTFEIVGTGRYTGEQNIRRAFGSIASNGLLHGEVNEHLQLEPLVTVAPGGREAWLRGFQLGMLGQNGVGAWWTQAIVETHFVQGTDGLWRIRSMRVFPKLRSDYYQGWARSQLPEPRPARGYEPDAPGLPLPAAGAGVGCRLSTFRIRSRAEPIAYPAGVIAIGANDAATAAARCDRSSAAHSPTDTHGCRHARPRWRSSRASSPSPRRTTPSRMSATLSATTSTISTGTIPPLCSRAPAGAANIRSASTSARSASARPRPRNMAARPSPRTSVQIHLRTQPVIDVRTTG